MFGGIGLLQGLVAALGAALCIGNVAALLRPPQAPKRATSRTGARRVGTARKPAATPTPPAPPLRRGQAIVMALIGFAIFLWSIASLFNN